MIYHLLLCTIYLICEIEILFFLSSSMILKETIIVIVFNDNINVRFVRDNLSKKLKNII